MNPEYDNLTTWDFWSLEEKLSLLLADKGYGLVNFDLTYNHNKELHPCLEVNTEVAQLLAGEIRKHGHKVRVKKNPNKRSLSHVFVENKYPVELLSIAESFKVIV